jgi:DHA3 family macrolide efflux protein-like MFS transporter
VLAGAIVLGLVAGLAAGGSLWNLASVRLRYVWLIFIALGLRAVLEVGVGAGLSLPNPLRIALLTVSYGFLFVGLAANRRYPGFLLALVGVLSNGIIILWNAGRMPIWEPSLFAAGFTVQDVNTSLHILLPAPLDASFLLHLGPLSDVIPIPLPIVRNVASIGDVFLYAGLAMFVFAAVLGRPAWMEQEEPTTGRVPAGTRRGRGGPRQSPLRDGPMVAGLAEMGEMAAMQRRAVLGGVGSAPAVSAPVAAPPSFGRRVLGHPYVRLTLNGDFSALWIGQLISFFGDRINQIAIVFLVFGLTGSPIAVSAVFVAAFLPNLVLGPIAGAFVDRWDHREVMVVSDLVRAATVLLIPAAAAVNVLLVYPLVFAVTSVTIFFRPARTAVIPRIVRDEELVTANSATWIGETLADVIGYPIAGLFVGFLGGALALAFWLDALTYVASAFLIATMAVPPVVRTLDRAGVGLRGVVDDLREGWRFLRGESVLLANTLQGVIAQVSVGTTIALTPVYAAEVLDLGRLDASTAYALLETAVGVGNLVGGFVVGLIGMRLARGRMVIVGFALYGACVAGLGLTGYVPLAIGLMAGCGIANMVYVIPSQTLFQERTPADLIGRVVSFRFALVTASMSAAMAAAGLLAAGMGVSAVLVASGVITAATGFAGLFTRAVRDA